MIKYAIVIGNSEYNPKANVSNLPFASNNAATVAKLLRNRRIGQFSETDVTLIINGKTSYIKRNLEELFSNGKRDDLIVVYFSCHVIADVWVPPEDPEEPTHFEDLQKQSISSKRFNLKNIRILLTEGFTAEELRRLCFDERDFRRVHEQLTPEMGKDRVIDRLLEYAEQKELMEPLLENAKERNPAKYERHQPYQVVATSPTTSNISHTGSQRAVVFRDLYLLTSDSEGQYLASTSIDISFIKSLMGKSEVNTQILIIDAYFSNAIGKESLLEGNNQILPLDELSGNGRYIIFATSSVQLALQDKDQKFSLFTRFLIEGLETGQADTGKDGLISVKELFDYASSKVIDATNHQQTPGSWGLDGADSLYLARSPRAHNPLVTELKLDPERVMKIVTKWGISKFDVLEGFTLDQELVMKPILTRAELKSCYLPPPSVQNVLKEIEADKSNKSWLFVSPSETGKTSLLTYLCVVVSKSQPQKKFVKIERVPSGPDINEFLYILEQYGETKPYQCVGIFDGNILEQDSLNLLIRLKASKHKVAFWATCTSEQYEKVVSQDFDLTEYFKIRHVPGYVDADKKFFELFVETKLRNRSPDERKMLLANPNLTFGQLCRFYHTPKNIRLKIISEVEAAKEIRTLFFSMPRTAQLLAQVIKWFGLIPEEVIQLLTSNTVLFNKKDYELILGHKFVFLESGSFGVSSTVVKPAGSMGQDDMSDLLSHEKTLVIDLLLDLASQQHELVKIASFAQTLSYVSKVMSEEQWYRYRQLTRRAEGGQICNFCGVCSSANMEWCPGCSRKLTSDLQDSVDESVQMLEGNLKQTIPFPMPEYAEDINRPKFIWSELDLSEF